MARRGRKRPASDAVVPGPSTAAVGGTWSPLSPADAERIAEAALDILCGIGFSEVPPHVIETITVTPTFESLSHLAAVVVLRTAVSWTLTLETEGRWPWQPPREELCALSNGKWVGCSKPT